MPYSAKTLLVPDIMSMDNFITRVLLYNCKQNQELLNCGIIGLNVCFLPHGHQYYAMSYNTTSHIITPKCKRNPIKVVHWYMKSAYFKRKDI